MDMKREGYEIVKRSRVESNKRTEWAYDIMFYDENNELMERRIEFEEDYDNLKEFSMMKHRGDCYHEVDFTMKKEMSLDKMMKAKSLKIRGERRKYVTLDWLKENYKEEAEEVVAEFGEDLVGIVAVESLVISGEIPYIQEIGCETDEKKDWVMVCKMMLEKVEETWLEFPVYYEVRDEMGGLIVKYEKKDVLNINKPREF